MAGPGIAIKIDGDVAGVQRMLYAVDTALNPIALAAFLGAVVDPYFRRRAGDRFAKEGDDVTGPWKPLAEATQNIRETMGYGPAHPINRREGELERYITQTQGRSTEEPWGASLTLPGAEAQGELESKFSVAQQGGISISGNPIPARPVLGMNEQDLIFVLTALAGHIEKVGGGVI